MARCPAREHRTRVASVSHSGDAHRASDQPGCAGLGWQEVTSQRSAVDGPTQGDCPIPQALQARTPAGQSWRALRETRPRGPVGAAGRQSHSSLCQEAPGTAVMESESARALSRADTLRSEARPGGRPGEPCPRPGSWRLLHGAGRGPGSAPLCPALASAQGKGLGGGRGGASAHACRRQPGAARLCLARSHPALAPWPCSAGAGHLEDRASHHPPHASTAAPRSSHPRRGGVAERRGRLADAVRRGRGTDLGGGGGAGVEAVADEHGQAVARAAQQLHRLAVREAQQALLVHLQQPQAHAQAAVAPCCSRGAHLQQHRAGPQDGRPSGPLPAPRARPSPWK